MSGMQGRWLGFFGFLALGVASAADAFRVYPITAESERRSEILG